MPMVSGCTTCGRGSTKRNGAYAHACSQPAFGIREDEATGSAAMRLTADLGRDLEIVQGRGSLLHTHVRYLGQQVEVGGRVSEAEMTELR